MLSIKNLLKPQAALFKLLKYKGIIVNTAEVREDLEKHPDSPSMLAICDVLSSMNIENEAFRIETEDLGNLSCPFLAHVNTKDGDVIVITRVTNNNVYISTDTQEKQKVKISEFKKIFTGVVLTIESGQQNGSAQTLTDKLSSIKTPALILATLAVAIAAVVFNSGYVSHISWQLLVLTVFKSAGFITSILLLIQSIDSSNPLVQALCQTKGKTDCNAILSSDAAQVFEGLTWSEVGFFYFSATWLLLLFNNGSMLSWSVLTIMNFASLPYTVYSIYYQARIAKKWCVLCCTVQALLWLEFIPFAFRIYKGSFSFNSDGHLIATLSNIFICMGVPVILWLFLKPLLVKSQQLQYYKGQLHKFKYNPTFFNNILRDQPKYALPCEDWSIMLGNVEAENIFTIISNPYCPPCSKTHKLLEDLLEHNDNIQARIIFSIPIPLGDRSTPVSRHLMALNELPDKTLVKNAIHDWYGQTQKNFEDWAKRYPVAIDENKFDKLDKQNEWCQIADVTATPTIMLNGYKLPKLYHLTDLKYMLS